MARHLSCARIFSRAFFAGVEILLDRPSQLHVGSAHLQRDTASTGHELPLRLAGTSYDTKVEDNANAHSFEPSQVSRQLHIPEKEENYRMEILTRWMRLVFTGQIGELREESWPVSTTMRFNGRYQSPAKAIFLSCSFPHGEELLSSSV